MDKILENILNVPTETQTVEFKRIEGNKIVKKIIETIVAMANTDGGIIVIGVDDPEKTKLKGSDRIYGIEENIELYDEIFQEIKRIFPPLNGLNPDIFKADNGKSVALLRVPKATESFCFIDNQVFIRLHKGNKKLTPQEIIKFSYAKGFEKADRELVEVDFDLLKTEYFDDWKSGRQLKGNRIQDVLLQTGLARKDKKGVVKPTRAAVLLFAKFPTDLLDTKCAVRVIQLRGTIEKFEETPNFLSKPKTFGGPIVDLIKNTQDYVLELIENGISIRSGFINKYKIPERAIKEAITNAVIHRDYHIKRDIEIRLFEDRIEVLSPGLFPYNITEYNIGFVRSDGYRNDLLVKHLREFPEPPNLDLNEGVRAMRSEMNRRNLYPPIFQTYPTLEDSIKVVLFNEEQPTEWEKIKKYLEKNKYINNETAREITGEVQVYKISKMFKKWTDQGLLIKINADSKNFRFTKYKLSNSKELKEDK